MPELVTLGPDAPFEEVIAVIERDGGVIIRDFVDEATIEGLEADLRAHLDETDWGKDDFSGGRTRRFGAVFNHTKHVIPVVRQPQWHAAAQHFIQGPSLRKKELRGQGQVPSYRIGVTQVIDIHPGQGLQVLHRDDGLWDYPHPEGYEQHARMQVMLAITEFTEENGGTMVVPGSHRWDDERRPLPEEAIPTVMAKGSALLWLGGVYHGGGMNESDSSRTGLTIGFDLGWLRQEENMYLSLDHEIVRGLPEDVQKLLGWELSSAAGFVMDDGEMASPIRLLA
ncbi:phytanoyl-CoA dioxygenase family protein [Nocardioides sp. GY 10127]|uniref:phytanoyl-CoA dioxygenase family protein n=1 Tax=Nocardioides sp. GY 10127 TaxID=2569762 RepID=UPI0010A925EF|nr:phytanoyl-CoA dioxygenase family protein [Nocardioides sp. GY 10127]TIC79114.1 phytanoyl-CoA dioxygenase family protein [Nocardioides sp. GY 10127]